jgi:hypothetical protein
LVHVVLIIVGIIHLKAFVALLVVFGVVSIATIVLTFTSIFVLVVLLLHLFLI